MTGDDDDRDDGRPDDVPLAETLAELLASDDSGLCAGLLDMLALLSDAGAARWLLHKAGALALVAAPGGYGFHECFAPEVIDAALGELADAGLVTIDEAVFDDAGDADDDDLAESAFDTVSVDPDAGQIIMARHVAAGTIAELGARACGVLEEAARSGAGIDYALLAGGMTACWDRLRPHLGAADDELAKDLLATRGWGLYCLVFYPDVNAAVIIEFGEKLVADYELALGPGHADAWETRRNMASAYQRCQRHDEAIDGYARLLADVEGALPADDGEILAARHDLARGYLNAGRYGEAVRQYTELLADYDRVLGPAHNLTLLVRGGLGEACLEVGRVAEGIELMEAAAAGLAALGGPDFPEVVRLHELIDEARAREAGSPRGSPRKTG